MHHAVALGLLFLLVFLRVSSFPCSRQSRVVSTVDASHAGPLATYWSNSTASTPVFSQVAVQLPRTCDDGRALNTITSIDAIHSYVRLDIPAGQTLTPGTQLRFELALYKTPNLATESFKISPVTCSLTFLNGTAVPSTLSGSPLDFHAACDTTAAFNQYFFASQPNKRLDVTNTTYLWVAMTAKLPTALEPILADGWRIFDLPITNLNDTATRHSNTAWSFHPQSAAMVVVYGGTTLESVAPPTPPVAAPVPTSAPTILPVGPVPQQAPVNSSVTDAPPTLPIENRIGLIIALVVSAAMVVIFVIGVILFCRHRHRMRLREYRDEQRDEAEAASKHTADTQSSVVRRKPAASEPVRRDIPLPPPTSNKGRDFPRPPPPAKITEPFSRVSEVEMALFRSVQDQEKSKAPKEQLLVTSSPAINTKCASDDMDDIRVEDDDE